ncbi:DELLA protein RGL1-like [Senna tora]|uniref:nucleoside-diphosphate kinase n=1 Tax=Senna tora TaxID=362788 RepID=A0A834WWT8_9FABA|nr:DELLA protein RGL1-like [Senna tora]
MIPLYSAFKCEIINDIDDDEEETKRHIKNIKTSSHRLHHLHFRDHTWTLTQRYLAAEATEEDMIIISNTNNDNEEEKHEMRLVQLLIACAEAVASRDKSHASTLLSHLRSISLVFGSSFQRVSSCFVQALSHRLDSLFQPISSVMIMNIMDINAASSLYHHQKMEEAYNLLYQISPHIQFGHYVGNSTILEAFEGHTFLHVLDLGMSLGLYHGHQWRGLIQTLVNRTGGHLVLRRLKITGVGLDIVKLQTIGEELEAYADTLGINLEFSAVRKNLEDLSPNDIKVHEGEVLVVNSILQLHCVIKESHGALNSVLQMIHNLSPKVLVMVEQDSSHNGPFFLGRFMEALHYYSAIFDSLDAMLPKYDTKRAKIEQFYFGEEIKNIMVARAKEWLMEKRVCDGFTLVEEKGCDAFKDIRIYDMRKDIEERVEETYIMVKPDGVQRGLVGEIISRFEKKGFKLKGLKLFQCSKELAEEHYKDLKAKSFFPKLIDYITSGPVVSMAWEGVGVVASARKLIGSTDPLQAEPGTIRGDLAVQTGRNIVHGSDSPENGQREIALWFKEGELCEWTPVLAPWLRE